MGRSGVQGEEDLAGGGAVGGEAAAGAGDDRGGPSARDLLQEQGVGAVRDGEVDVLVGGLVQVAQVRQRRVPQFAHRWRGLAEDEEPQADAVAAVRGAFDQAEPDQFADQPVRGGFRQPGAQGEFGEGEGGPGVPAGTQQGHSACEYRLGQRTVVRHGPNGDAWVCGWQGVRRCEWRITASAAGAVPPTVVAHCLSGTSTSSGPFNFPAPATSSRRCFALSARTASTPKKAAARVKSRGPISVPGHRPGPPIAS